MPNNNVPNVAPIIKPASGQGRFPSGNKKGLFIGIAVAIVLLVLVVSGVLSYIFIFAKPDAKIKEYLTTNINEFNIVASEMNDPKTINDPNLTEEQKDRAVVAFLKDHRSKLKNSVNSDTAEFDVNEKRFFNEFIDYGEKYVVAKWDNKSADLPDGSGFSVNAAKYIKAINTERDNLVKKYNLSDVPAITKIIGLSESAS
ncbi:MAG: hypothetical protein WCJ19_02495 [bacterium]